MQFFVDTAVIADIRELVRELPQRDIGVLITDHNVRETLDIIDRASIISATRPGLARAQALMAGHEACSSVSAPRSTSQRPTDL